jgi:hypothetical protein
MAFTYLSAHGASIREKNTLFSVVGSGTSSPDSYYKQILYKLLHREEWEASIMVVLADGVYG